jgi:uncharacterized protein YndB with AHSA1/START domain
MNDRVELQQEVDARQAAVFALVSTSAGLRQWLDDGEIDARVGGEVHLRMREAEATGRIVAYDPPQHISFAWQWTDEAEPAGVVAFDAIDHGARTHLTVRHVGLGSRRRVLAHEELWRYWLARLVGAAEGAARKAALGAAQPPA